jgi:hypothetical protein
LAVFFIVLGIIMALTRTTELDAVNVMLGTIGESPINSLENISGVADAVIARQVLSEIAVQVQEEGWHFNTEKNFTLTPTVSGAIFVADNVLEVDSTEDDAEVDVTLRGNRLYDRTNKTYVFTKDIKCTLTLLFEFEELPQAARHYVMIRAARVFQQRVVGSDVLANFSQTDEAMARMALKRYDAKSADYNMLTGNYSVMRVLDR